MKGKRFSYIAIALLSIGALAMPPQDDKTQKQKSAAKAQPVLQVEDETIPDSLLHPRWKIQKTAPIEVADLDSSALDLHLPTNIRQQVEYDDSLNVYKIGSKLGDSYLNAPVLMTPEEYRQWSERKEREAFFRKKPDIHISTKEAYAGVTPHESDIFLPEILRNSPEDWRNLVVNDFEESLFKKIPALKTVKEALYHEGALYASMSGSGSAFFGVFGE